MVKILFTKKYITQIFNSIAEHVIPMRIPIKEEKAEIEIHPAIAEAKIRKCWIKFRGALTFLCFLLSIHFALFLQGNNFLFHLYFLI